MKPSQTPKEAQDGQCPESSKQTRSHLVMDFEIRQLVVCHRERRMRRVYIVYNSVNWYKCFFVKELGGSNLARYIREFGFLLIYIFHYFWRPIWWVQFQKTGDASGFCVNHLVHIAFCDFQLFVLNFIPNIYQNFISVFKNFSDTLRVQKSKMSKLHLYKFS